MAKKIYISLRFSNYRNGKQNSADYLFGSNCQVNVGFRRLRRWNSTREKFGLY
jgi:hypothetical protein